MTSAKLEFDLVSFNWVSKTLPSECYFPKTKSARRQNQGGIEEKFNYALALFLWPPQIRIIFYATFAFTCHLALFSK